LSVIKVKKLYIIYQIKSTIFNCTFLELINKCQRNIFFLFWLSKCYQKNYKLFVCYAHEPYKIEAKLQILVENV